MDIAKNKLLSGIGDLSEKRFDDLMRELLMYHMEDEEQNNLTIELLDKFLTENREDLMELYINIMRNTNSSEDTFPYLSRLITLDLSQDVLASVSQVFDMEYFFLVNGLMNIHDHLMIARAVVNLDILYPDVDDLDADALRVLRDKAYDSGNTQLVMHLNTKTLLSERVFADIPVWIIDRYPLPYHEDLVKSISVTTPPVWENKTLQEDIDFMCYLSEKEENVDVELLREDLAKTFGAMRKEERWRTISWIMKNMYLSTLEGDEEIFRILGGCLPSPDGVLDELSPDPCSRHGGCRSMTCYHHENWDPATEEKIFADPVGGGNLDELEWFTGRCDYYKCSKYIRKRHYAVRMPIETGGWRGCYCSFDCVREEVYEDNTVRLYLINRIQSVYENIGIYDRK